MKAPIVTHDFEEIILLKVEILVTTTSKKLLKIMAKWNSEFE